MRTTFCLALTFLLVPLAQAGDKDLSAALQAIEKFPLKEKPDYGADIRKRRDEFNRADVARWKNINTLDDWEKARVKIQASLRNHVVPAFEPQKNVKHLVTSTVPGEGFVIENIVYETVPGLVVTANLYRPEPEVRNPPAILIIHSHHNPKTQGELQDMGMMWARLGCLVLIPDQINHGERRQHPFKDAASFPEAFKVGRQDYYFRYNVGAQLALIGESLAGWMARDMMRGVDLVLERGADPKRIILMGSVAGGGDPAAVTAAADERISCVVPFNFGGPQPETKFPLPDDAETWFNYHGSGGWESTRNLAFSASGGIPPWAIVASVAPRKLIHAHEFAWDAKRDPVFKRYEKIWTLYKDRDGLGVAHGTGTLSGKPPEASHCNNIGAVHRKMIYPLLKKWFDIPVPEKEYQARVPSEKLICLTDKAIEHFKPKTVAALALEQAAQWKKKQDFWERHFEGVPRKTKAFLTGPHFLCLQNLFDSKPAEKTMIVEASSTDGFVSVSRFLLQPKDLPVAAITLLRAGKVEKPRPLVVAVAQQGSDAFLKQRAETIASLLDQGAAVALVDMRGTGALAFPGDGRGRSSVSTGLSSSEWMMGHSLMEQRLRDLRLALSVLRASKSVDPKRVALWGDSFAPVNDDKTRIEVPYEGPKMPALAEPLGPILAQFAALMEPEIKAVYGRGSITSYTALLQGPFFYAPHDVFVPGILQAGDLPLLAGSLSPMPLRLEGFVDGVNRPARKEDLAAYGKRTDARTTVSPPRDVAAWLLRALE